MFRTPRSASLVSLLLAWFSTNARDLPWRRTRDPYAIWVSEIMLQQTQVKTVVPYWEHWMRKLPTIQSAAQASPAKLHKLWEGLGYYTRVRNLQRAAQQILEQHGGKFPTDFDAVLALPGIGRYTAGAICSIAFNQPTPILDGNVIRVLTRLFGIATHPREKKTNARLWHLANELVLHASRLVASKRSEDGITHHASSCSQLNQSLMELGALVCTPRQPRCDACPVNQHCLARRRGWQEKLPNLGKRQTATARRFIAFVVERDGKFLVRQRLAGVVNAHLWEFPNIEVGARLCEPQHSRSRSNTQPKSELNSTRTRCGSIDPRSEIARSLGFHPISAKPLCVIKHSITRYRITLEAWRAELKQLPTKLPGRWLKPVQLAKLAFTSAHKKILNRLQERR